MIELGQMDELDVREAAELMEEDAREFHEKGLLYAEDDSRDLSKRLLDLADRIGAAFQQAVAHKRQEERVVLDPVGEPSIPKQEIRRAVRERRGEEPQLDKNRGYTQPQVNEGSCDVCDMRWTGYGPRCPVCKGEQ